MASRFLFLLVAAFWVTMNILLWRSEFGGKPLTDSIIPIETVWERILTAPDRSVLEIYHGGKEAGYCRWSARIRTDPGTASSGAFEPEGRVTRFSGYELQMEGSVQLDSIPQRVGFDAGLVLSTNQALQELALRIVMRPDSWAIRVLAPEQKLMLSIHQDGEVHDRTLGFADLRDPRFLAEFGGLGALPMLALMAPGGVSGPLRLPIHWEARSDWLQVKNTRLRVYRLHARFLPPYEAVIYVSRAGEILRAELPDGIVLVNEAIAL
jgi:hypothetical protein